MEEWKDIKGYEEIYQISTKGRIKSKGNSFSRKEKEIKQTKTKSGYYTVGLHKGGKVKRYRVHRLVAETFIDNPFNLPEVNHIDENKANNEMTNLEWCTHKENCNHGTRNNRMAETNINNPKRSKPILCIEKNVVYPSIHEASRSLNTSYGNIWRALNNELRTASGYHWQYV